MLVAWLLLYSRLAHWLCKDDCRHLGAILAQCARITSIYNVLRLFRAL